MSDSKRLYFDGPAAGAKAPILIAHFEGAMDAGSAGTLAVVQLLRSLTAQRVATFDSDELLDFRSHRPIMQVEDWVTKDMTDPQIALDLVHDDAGLPILILHGPEPDSRWNAFRDAIDKLAEDAGVEAVFSFHGLPAAVPHTRPTAIHLQGTDADLIPDQPLMGGIARFPAPFTAYLQHHLSERNLTGITLLATVPYYMSDSTFPRASSALLRRLADLAGLSLPIGDLERGADTDATQVENLLEHNPDLQRTVNALEQHYDSISEAAAEGAELDEAKQGDEKGLEEDDFALADLPTWELLSDSTTHDEGIFPEAERLDETGTDSMADAIGDAVESYLKMRSKKNEVSENRFGPSRREKGFEESEKRVSEKQSKRHIPRHRAPSAWEIERQKRADLEQATSEEADGLGVTGLDSADSGDGNSPSLEGPEDPQATS